MKIHIIGSSSKIASIIADSIKDPVCKYSSKSHHLPIDNFYSQNLNGDCVIVLCYIKDNLLKNEELVSKLVAYSKNFKCKLIYISTINAQFPNGSYYSLIKKKCEDIVLTEGYSVVRLGLVISTIPFGPYKSLLSLLRLPFRPIFPASCKLVTTDEKLIQSYNWQQSPNNINSLYSSKISLNDFFKNNHSKFKLPIRIGAMIALIHFASTKITLKGILNRILTLTAIRS